MTNGFSVPILFIVFNRPDLTEHAFARIRDIKPKRLFIAADGPREGVEGEREKCEETRRLTTNIDWDCDVKTLFHEKNLGCQNGVKAALDWFFENVEAGIILEDDCVADPSFFPFCQELLERYQDNNEIMMISGDNFQKGKTEVSDCYYFSRYTDTWGWATWRRAWHFYDINIARWPELRDKGFLRNTLSRPEAKYWTKIFNEVYHNLLHYTWDYQWMLCCWMQGGLSISPSVNLITNIGFGPDAVHTTTRGTLLSLPAEVMEFPLKHPPEVVRNAQADIITFYHRYNIPFLKRVIQKIKVGWKDI